MDEKQFHLLIKKMDSVAKLLALNIVKEMSVNDQIETLSKAGLKASDIAELLNKTENQVYVTQSQIKKSKKKELKELSEPSSTQKEEQFNG